MPKRAKIERKKMTELAQKLRVETVRIERHHGWQLLDNLPKSATCFIRNGDGIAGFGEALRLSAIGPKRVEELSAKWRAVSAAAQIVDAIGLPGSGLVAFGTIAFADDSRTESVLVVPSYVLAARDGRFWLTEIELAGETVSGDRTPLGDRVESVLSTMGVGLGEDNQDVDLRAGDQSAEAFKRSVSAAVSTIRAGGVEKVVLARDLVGSLPAKFDIRPALRRLADRYPTCWVYSVDGNFGASPELLVRVAHGQVSARVLAGTAGRGTDPSVDQAIATALAESNKNTTEHAFAVDSLVEALRPFCDHVDADPKPFSLALPNLWHLASDVHGVLKSEASSLDLTAALHPTAAVAGTPRGRAVKLIGELEPFNRGRYAGPVGWIGADGDGEWAIALRGAQIDFTANEIRAFAGCGIVAESDPDAELAETELKFQPIRLAL